MKKVKVILESTSLNFLWAEKGYKYPDGELSTASWEDISFIIFVDDKKYKESHTTVDAKSYIQYEIDLTKGEFGQKMEIDYPGYIDEQLNDLSCFGMTYEELIKCDHIVLGYSYDSITDPEKHEIDGYNLPVNEDGMKPCYIMGFVPVEYLNRKAVEDFMKLYIGTHYDFGEKYDLSFEWDVKPSDEDLETQWKEHLEDMEHFQQMKKDGKEFEIRFAIPFLKQLYGDDVIQEYVDRGMEYGMQIKGSDEIILNFEDGHTELLKDEDDIQSDHFSGPELPGV